MLSIRKKSRQIHATAEKKRVPSKWQLQIMELYLQVHCICNTAIQTTGPFVHLGIGEGYWKQ